LKAEDAVKHMEANGCRASCLPFERLKDAKKDLEDLRKSGALTPEFFDLHLKNFKWEKPEDFQNARSIIIVSKAVPMIRTWFTVDGKKIDALVPPTYAGWSDVSERLRKMLEDFAPGHRFQYVFVPNKTLATRSGLARYGRNNITYVEGFGSYQRLAVYLTDLECTKDNWGEKKMLDRCEKCTTCIRMCPTRSISRERFLLYGDTCLTHLNEQSADKPFPAYVKPEMHNAIIGCMVCQKNCPEDRKFVGFVEDRAGFDDKETAYLLKGDFSDEKKAKEMEKNLARVGIDLSVFPRNLVALVESEKCRAT
jgi:epoxyqueuosine reductase